MSELQGREKDGSGSTMKGDWKHSGRRQRDQMEGTVVPECEMTKTYTMQLHREMKSRGQRQEIHKLREARKYSEKSSAVNTEESKMMAGC